jgi:hypothetical protein
MTPPPPASVRKCVGRPNSSASQSTVTVSSSVQAGLVAHNIPCTPSPLDSRSPRIAGPLAFDG